jgi:hypothetical protein
VNASFSNGDTAAPLVDNGVAPDAFAADGIYTGTWLPAALGPVTVTFTALHGIDTYGTTATGSVVEFMGYYYDDAIPYNWVEISGTGTPLYLGDDDQAIIPLPFLIDFYDGSYNSITIGSNGDLFFENNLTDYWNLCIPATTYYGVETYAAPFWTDLKPSAGGQVYYDIRGSAPSRTLIVEYLNVPHYWTPGTVSFEIIFHEYSDDIIMQYNDVNFGDVFFDAGVASTVGLQRDGAYGQQYLCLEALLSNQMAIRWYRDIADEPTISLSTASLSSSSRLGLNAPGRSFGLWNSGTGTLSYSITDDVNWLWVSPASGTSIGEHDTLTANFSTSALVVGEYSATITIVDPGAANSPQTVAVSVTIDPPSYSLTTGVSPAGAGSVTGGGTYEEGATATVQAYPNQGWMFDHWQGGGIDGSTQNPEKVAMNGGRSVTAVFVPHPLSRITLVYPPSGAVIYWAPSFTWVADYGSQNAFVVDFALGGQIRTSSVIEGLGWNMPNAAWDRISSGTLVYWRVRGADTAIGPPYDVVTSEEIRWFYKY